MWLINLINLKRLIRHINLIPFTAVDNSVDKPMDNPWHNFPLIHTA